MTRFADGGIDKEYLAVVRGYTEESGVIDYALLEERDRIADAMPDPNPAPQNAITHYLARRQSSLSIPWDAIAPRASHLCAYLQKLAGGIKSAVICATFSIRCFVTPPMVMANKIGSLRTIWVQTD